MPELWGKWSGLPGRYPLRWHLLDTAAAAHVLWEAHLSEGVRAWIGAQLRLGPEQTRRFVTFLAGLHDVGKACPCFQNQSPKPGEANWIHHAEVSYLTLTELLREPGREYRILMLSSPYRMAELLGGHHGFFWSSDRRTVRNPAVHRVNQLGDSHWQNERRRLVEDLRSLLGHPELPAEISGQVAAVLAGLVILADWVASDGEWISTSQWRASRDPFARWDHTVRGLRDRLPALGLSVPELADIVTTDMILGKQPNALQASIERDFRPDAPGLLVITASTGYGKTEAAFVGVHRFGAVTGRPGMVVCLPTQATTNAMWGRGTAFAGRVAASDRPVTLAHTMSAFYQPYRDYCADDEVLEWLNGRHKPLLAGMSVVTIDQVLIAALATKFNMLRLWGLLGKTLVVDEVHAADPYMQALLARLLSWCGHLGISVILISATLPQHITRAMTAAYLTGADPVPENPPVIETPSYPGWLFTSCQRNVQRPSAASVEEMREHSRRDARIKRLEYRRGTRIDRILRYIGFAVDGGGCVSVVCSTVASAQHTFERVRAFLSARPSSAELVPLWLLHARFPYHQRRRIEGEVITRFGKYPTEDHSRPRTGIVITTSILEQSLDVDFDLVISDLVPIAHLLQRLGRVWRHPHTRPSWIPKPALVVLDPALERFPEEWTSIYPEYELAATRRMLEGDGLDLVVPHDVDKLVQHVHNHDLPPIDDEAKAAWAERQSTTTLHKALAGYVTIPAPHMVGGLHELTNRQVKEKDVTTRLGVDNIWLIPRYTSDDGRYWLDPEHSTPFPSHKPGHSEVMSMIDASTRCPANWVQGWGNPYAEFWRRTPLFDALPFPAPAHGGLRLDSALGLVNEAQHDYL
ncbi:CRISPR-associated helicase Cas3' [Nocardia sp. NPDC050406]|uniref:CRISPR-associated helicase Cas3' n=1 Tax=Nocardia sp. NPDC050406 TaxID=3364318 RepID=UPI0037ADB44C